MVGVVGVGVVRTVVEVGVLVGVEVVESEVMVVVVAEVASIFVVSRWREKYGANSDNVTDMSSWDSGRG